MHKEWIKKFYEENSSTFPSNLSCFMFGNLLSKQWLTDNFCVRWLMLAGISPNIIV